jgi:hypothetical protein
MQKMLFSDKKLGFSLKIIKIRTNSPKSAKQLEKMLFLDTKLCFLFENHQNMHKFTEFV